MMAGGSGNKSPDNKTLWKTDNLRLVYGNKPHIHI